MLHKMLHKTLHRMLNKTHKKRCTKRFTDKALLTNRLYAAEDICTQKLESYTGPRRMCSTISQP